MRKLKSILTITLLFTLCGGVFAHGGEKHKKKSETKVENTFKSSDKIEKASMDDFPTLHPMVVHFPIMLLLLAAIAQLAGLFVFQNELSWVTLFLALFGLIGAYAAGEYVHPHTTGLNEKTQWLLEQHERFADYTLWTALVGTILKALSHFVFKRKMWAEVATLIILSTSAFVVAEAGHYGAQLIHIEGVGAAGKNLELGEH